MAAAGTGMTREGYKGFMQVADTGIQRITMDPSVKHWDDIMESGLQYQLLE